MIEYLQGVPVAIVAAIITFAGTVVFSPIFARIIAKYFDKRSRLTVDFYAADIGNNAIFERIIPLKYDDSANTIGDEVNNVLRMFKGYVNLKIKNSSSSTIRSITVSVPTTSSFKAVVQIDSRSLLEIFDDTRPVKIGDLQPHCITELHLYSRRALANEWMSSLKDLHVSADQIDEVSKNFPLPRYIKEIQRDKSRNRELMAIKFLLVCALFVLAVLLSLLVRIRS